MTETRTTDQTPFPLVAAELRRQIDAAMPRLRTISGSDAEKGTAPGKWSPQQVIGHLIDSASNNHQRFVRAQENSTLVFPGYAQEHWVRCQRYEASAWDDLTNLWQAYNLHIAHVIEHIPEAHRNVQCLIGTYPPATLGFLAHDYVVHLRHHLKQIHAVA
ncbi:MAG TPA: DinB family protein [Vicinamibacterales bacterium]|nr:DinB family protein [Vicinamibacterales bacterium]